MYFPPGSLCLWAITVTSIYCTPAPPRSGSSRSSGSDTTFSGGSSNSGDPLGIASSLSTNKGAPRKVWLVSTLDPATSTRSANYGNVEKSYPSFYIEANEFNPPMHIGYLENFTPGSGPDLENMYRVAIYPNSANAQYIPKDGNLMIGSQTLQRFALEWGSTTSDNKVFFDPETGKGIISSWMDLRKQQRGSSPDFSTSQALDYMGRYGNIVKQINQNDPKWYMKMQIWRGTDFYWQHFTRRSLSSVPKPTHVFYEESPANLIDGTTDSSTKIRYWGISNNRNPVEEDLGCGRRRACVPPKGTEK